MKERVSTNKLITFDQVDDTLFKLAHCKIARENKENDMNKKILNIKKDYEPGINEMDDMIAEYEELIEDFLNRNKKEFTLARSKKLTYGIIGFRTGKSALKLIKGFNWEIVKGKFSDLFKTKYINVKTTFNKSKVIADAEKGIIAEAVLYLAGCKLVKGETAFYEINLESIEKEKEK